MTERDKQYLLAVMRALKLLPKSSKHDEWRGLMEVWTFACERYGVTEEAASQLEAQVHRQLERDGWLPT